VAGDSHGSDLDAQADLGLVLLRLGQPALQHAFADLHLRPLHQGNPGRRHDGAIGLGVSASARRGSSSRFSRPILGALADTAGNRMRWIWLFSVMYVVGSAGLWLAAPDDFNLYLVLLPVSRSA
jgi:hypothetical protein